VGWIVRALDLYGRYVAFGFMLGVAVTLAVWLIVSLVSWWKAK
jgi:hypothetical protein